MMRRYLPAVALSATLIACSGCSHERAWRDPDLVLQVGEPVAVVPFTTRTVNAEAGEIITTMMINELRVRGVAVMAPLITPEKAPTMATPAAVLQALGRRLRTRYLMLGEVTEYAYKRGLGEEPTVGISARLVDAITGEVVWTGVRAEVGGWSILHEDSLARISQRTVEKLAATLAIDEPVEHQPARSERVKPDALRPMTWELPPMGLMDLGVRPATEASAEPAAAANAPAAQTGSSATTAPVPAEAAPEPYVRGPERLLGQSALSVTGTITAGTLAPTPNDPRSAPVPMAPAAPLPSVLGAPESNVAAPAGQAAQRSGTVLPAVEIVPEDAIPGSPPHSRPTPFPALPSLVPEDDLRNEATPSDRSLP